MQSVGAGQSANPSQLAASASTMLREQKHNFAGLSDEPFSHARRLQPQDATAWAERGQGQ